MISKIALFAARKPKMVATIVVVLVCGAFAVHYKLLVGERDKLRIAQEAYEVAIDRFREREASLQTALENERAAAAVVAAERDEARRAIDVFRAGRENDPEALEWARQALPLGELERLCAALPEMGGCQVAQ